MEPGEQAGCWESATGVQAKNKNNKPKARIRIVAVGIERWDWILEIYTEICWLAKRRWQKRQSRDAPLFSALGEEARRAGLRRK